MALPNNGSEQPVVTPKLATPQKVGELAPTKDAPVLDQEAMKRLMEDEVKRRVAKELEGLSRDKAAPDEDPAFNDFSKKLELFGINLNELQQDFHLHWINDERDRLLRLQTQGYTFVSRSEVALSDAVAPLNQDLGDNIAVYAGVTESGAPMRTYLMKIPKAIYEKRQASIQRQQDMVDEALRRGTVGPAATTKNSYAGTDQGQVKINIGRPPAAVTR